MRITARFNKEDQELVTDLLCSRILAKLVKGGVIADLPVRIEGKSFDFPDKLHDAKLFIELCEHGGGAKNTGTGTVVCGVSGKALHPFYRPRGGHLACGEHAYFSIPGAVVTVTCERPDNKIVIQQYWIFHDGNVAEIGSKELWSGRIMELPELFGRFRSAAFAANEKANCYHCREPHYISEQSTAPGTPNPSYE